jgi:hypothetical protein
LTQIDGALSKGLPSGPRSFDRISHERRIVVKLRLFEIAQREVGEIECPDGRQRSPPLS